VLSFPDWTFLFQIALFLLLWTFLRRSLFEPNFAVIKAREERGAGAVKEASRVKAEAQAMGEQYAAQLLEARTGATQQVDALYRDAEAQAQSVINAARDDAAQTIAQMRDSLQKEIIEARQSLEARAPEFSNEIAQKLLGRSLT